MTFSGKFVLFLDVDEFSACVANQMIPVWGS